jgi:hypothetical protein
MKTFVALLVAVALAGPAAAVTPRCPGGRFLVDGDPLDLGAPADRVPAVEVGTADPPSVRVDGPCAPADGTRVLRPRATIVRALLEGCGDAPRTRLRIRLPRGCDGASIRVRRVGVTIAERRLRLDPGTTATPHPPVLTGFSVDHGVPDDVVTVSGTDLDRDGSGARWEGSPPWHVVFDGPPFPGLPADADFSFVSPTELRVTVPRVVFVGAGLAVSSSVSLVDDHGTITTAPDPFFISPQPDPPPHLRVENRSQYRIVSLRQDGIELITDPAAVIPLGGDADFPPSGAASAELDVGYGVSFGAPVITESFSAALDLFGANTVPLGPITIAQLLTDFDANAAHLHTWVSHQFLGADHRLHVETLAVSRDGTWSLFVDNGPAATRNGTLTLVQWPDEALSVDFSLATDLPVATVRVPFTSFTMGALTFTAQ